MNDSPTLLARIEAHSLDARGAADPFSRRLARENGWSDDYAQRVVREYQRFLVLAIAAGHAVTPSDQVDQAWHLHLLYTAHYRRFCRQALGRRLDHGPSEGGSHERRRYVRDYERTLDSYQARFGEPPPSDIWPSSGQRFGTDLSMLRVNTSQHWVLRKPRAWRWLEARWSAADARARVSALMATALVALGCGGDIGLSTSVSGSQFLRGFFWLWLVTWAIAYAVRRWTLRSTETEPPLLEPYDLAQLAGEQVALDSAITSLIAQNAIELIPGENSLRVKGTLAAHAAQLERDVYAEIEQAGSLDVAELRGRVIKLTAFLALRLEALGLMTTGESQLPFWLALVAPLLGAVRAMSRIGTDKPVALLVIWCVLGVLVAFWIFRPRPERTSLGEATLARYRQAHAALRETRPADELASAGTLPIAFALFGMSALALPQASGWSELMKRQSRPETSGSSGGCGAGDGGSDGGGGDGGGGCGGCGGGCGGCGG
jgi:uncharacterized protein (TIGR04222 family)